MNYNFDYHPPGDLQTVWSDLRHQGYATTADRAIGLPAKFRENFTETYFVDGIIRHDEGDWPQDRQRARDVIRYRWVHNKLELEEHETIKITDRADIKGERIHSRVELLKDPQAAELIRGLLHLVSPDRRQSEGTFGINLFRTFTNVISKPHKDSEEFIILYVLDRVGDGAESYLYETPLAAEDCVTAQANHEPSAEPIFRKQFNPGELIIFEDARFNHGATPLEDPPGGRAVRDVLVCTVDHWSTYLQASHP